MYAMTIANGSTNNNSTNNTSSNINSKDITNVMDTCVEGPEPTATKENLKKTLVAEENLRCKFSFF